MSERVNGMQRLGSMTNEDLFKCLFEGTDADGRLLAAGAIAVRLSHVVDAQGQTIQRLSQAIDTLEMVLYPLLRVLQEREDWDIAEVFSEDLRKELLESGNLLKFLGLEGLLAVNNQPSGEELEELAKKRVEEMVAALPEAEEIEEGTCALGECPHPWQCTAAQRCLAGDGGCGCGTKH